MEPLTLRHLLQSKFLFSLILILHGYSNAGVTASCPDVACDFRNRWCGWSNDREARDGLLEWELKDDFASLDMRYQHKGAYGLLTSPLVEPRPDSVCRLRFRYSLGGRGCGLSLVKQSAISSHEVLWAATDVSLWQVGFFEDHTKWFNCDNGGPYRLTFKGERTGPVLTCGPPWTRINIRDVSCTMNQTTDRSSSPSATDTYRLRTTVTSRESTSRTTKSGRTSGTSKHSTRGTTHRLTTRTKRRTTAGTTQRPSTVTTHRSTTATTDMSTSATTPHRLTTVTTHRPTTTTTHGSTTITSQRPTIVTTQRHTTATTPRPTTITPNPTTVTTLKPTTTTTQRVTTGTTQSPTTVTTLRPTTDTTLRPTTDTTFRPTTDTTFRPTTDTTLRPTTDTTLRPTTDTTLRPTTDTTLRPATDTTFRPTTDTTLRPTTVTTLRPTTDTTLRPTTDTTFRPTTDTTFRPTTDTTLRPTTDTTLRPTTDTTLRPTTDTTLRPTTDTTLRPTTDTTFRPTTDTTLRPTTVTTLRPTTVTTLRPTTVTTQRPTTVSTQPATVTAHTPTKVTTHRPTGSTTQRPTEGTTHHHKPTKSTTQRPSRGTTQRPSGGTTHHKRTTSEGTREPTTPDICSPSFAGFGPEVTPNRASRTADCASPGPGLTVPLAAIAAGVVLIAVLVAVALVCRRRRRQQAGRTVRSPGAGCNRTFIQSCLNQSTNDDGSDNPLIDDGATNSGRRGYGSHDPASSGDLSQPGGSTGVHRSEVVARGSLSAEATSQAIEPADATDAQHWTDTLSAAITTPQPSPVAAEKPRRNSIHSVRSLEAASGNYEVVTLGDSDSGTSSLGPAASSSDPETSISPDEYSCVGQRVPQGVTDETTASKGCWHSYDSVHQSASLTVDGYSDLNRNGDPSKGQRRNQAYDNYSHV